MSKNLKVVYQVRVNTGLADTPLSSYIPGYTRENCQFDLLSDAQRLAKELNSEYGNLPFLPPRFYVMRIAVLMMEV